MRCAVVEKWVRVKAMLPAGTVLRAWRMLPAGKEMLPSGTMRWPGTVPAAAALAAVLVASPARAEVFVDVGVQRAEHEAKIANVDTFTSTDASLHLGVGVRRDVGARGSIGARLELDDVDSTTFIAVRAFDYAYHFSDRFAFTAFLGAARLNLRTPAYGYYLGAGVRFKDFAPRWDLGLDLRVGDKLARDNREPEDPGTIGLANFHDVTSVSLYTTYRFGGARRRGSR